MAVMVTSTMSQAWADVIRRIEVQGAQRVEAKTVLSYLTVEPGDEFSQDQLDESLKALFATGLFADVRLQQDVRTLIVEVVENPIVNEVAFEGNLRIEDTKLSPEVQLRSRAIFTKAKAQSDVARIQEVYRRSGRFAVKVEPKIIELDQNRVNVVFEIDEGPQTRIQGISFVNNKKFSDKALRSVVSSAETRWYKFLSNDDTYDPDRMEYDKELLRRFYLENGYVDFDVTSAIAELSQDREGFYLTFTVNEGERYQYGDITLTNRLDGVDLSDLGEIVIPERGDWFDDTEIDETKEDLTRAVEGQLFPFVNVRSELDIDRAKRLVNVNFIIQESSRVFVNRIDINGNVRTMDKVIRREFELAEGDPFNRDKLQKTETNLRDLGYFENVDIQTLPGDTPDSTNIDVTVSEQSTGELSIGAGFSTADGPLADFRIRERNFLGRGQELSLATTLAGERSEVDLGFVEPYFLNRDLRFSTNVFHVTRDLQDESSYDETRTGFGLNLGYPLSRHLRQTIGYRIQANDITDVQNSASRFIREQEGERTTSAVSQRLFYDRRNSTVNPTEGYSLSLFNELAGLGGNAKFFNTELGGAYYQPIYEDDWILTLGGKGGAIYAYDDDEVSINDRYFLGDSSFRGFEQAGVGPRDVSTNDSLGGTKYYSGTVELTFPLGFPEEYGIKGHSFSDFGSLWDTPGSGGVISDDNSFRASAGVGASWDSPLGPIRVNFAWPIVSEDYDQEQVFNFAFGTRF